MKEYRNEKGRLHRDDGPAVELSDGSREWYFYNRNITDQVESWIKEQGITLPFDKQTQVLFLLRFG